MFGDELIDSIWNLTQCEQHNFLTDIIVKYVDSEWFEKYNVPTMVPFDIQQNKEQNTNENKEPKKWIEFSMATPLKKICSVLFSMPYHILLAQTPKDRIARETITFKADGREMNGRVCLEYFGTDILRKMFDGDIWVKLLIRDAKESINLGNRVIIPDVRFENEVRLINELNGTLMVVCRDLKDLVLTDKDYKTHPAKWSFLECYEEANNYTICVNSGDIESLSKQIIKDFKC